MLKPVMISYSLVLLIMVGATGCQSLGLNGYTSKVTGETVVPWWKKKDDLPPIKKPGKLVAIWSNSVLNAIGNEPMRGLGGRIYFYDEKHQPVRVDGKLAVFLYDDSDQQNQEQQEATKQIQFSKEQVARSYTPSEFGPSYSFWVPWDEVGGRRTQLSVIPVFTTSEGEMLVGEQARYLLPGQSPTEVADDDTKDSNLAQASYVNEEPDQNSKIRLKSSTIRVPEAVQQRLRTIGSTKRTSQSRPDSKLDSNEIRQDVESSQLNLKQAIHEREFKQTLAPKGRPRVSELRGQSLSRTRSTPRPRLNWRNKTTTSNDQETRPASNTNGKLQIPPSGQESQPSAGLLTDPHQVQALQSAQQAAARGPNALDRAKSLFTK